MRRAFTLLELLIIIAVVCIMAALLFPVGTKSRESARRSSCQSNLKQIGLGFMQYIRDYDEKWPLAYTDNDGSGDYDAALDAGWMQITQPYLKSTQIFQCPSEATSYAPPTDATDYWYSAPVSQTPRMTYVVTPNLTVMVGDGTSKPAAFVATHGALAYKGNAPALKYNGEIWDTTGATEGQGGRRHLDGLNFLFCDGHVRWLKPEVVGAAPVAAGKPTFRVR